MTMIFSALENLGMFGVGSLATGFIALCISMLDDEYYGFKDGTCFFVSGVLWAVAWIGGIFFLGGKGILW